MSSQKGVTEVGYAGFFCYELDRLLKCRDLLACHELDRLLKCHDLLACHELDRLLKHL